MKSLRVGLALFAMYGRHCGNREFSQREWLALVGFSLADHIPLFLTVRLDHSAIDPVTDPPGYMWSGSGNPAEGFPLQQNPWTHTELALKGKYRQGPDIAPTFIGGDGAVHIVVPDGPQVIDPAHGVPVATCRPCGVEFRFLVVQPRSTGSNQGSRATMRRSLLFDLDPIRRRRNICLSATRPRSRRISPCTFR